MLIFYDKLPCHPDFDDVSMADFKEVADRSGRDRKPKVRDGGNVVLSQRYSSIGAPPPSSLPRRQPPATGRSSSPSGRGTGSPSPGNGGLLGGMGGGGGLGRGNGGRGNGAGGRGS